MFVGDPGIHPHADHDRHRDQRSAAGDDTHDAGEKKDNK
jgi:hypothetical protein